MKRALLIALPILAITIGAVGIFLFPARLRLASTSPSGKSHVSGLRFQGQSANPLDGTLRLIVTHNQAQIKQQTILPWGRDLAIQWRTSNEDDIFTVEKEGCAVIELQIHGCELKCTKGNEYLADDPYEQAAPSNTP